MTLDFPGNTAPEPEDASPEARSSLCCPLTPELASLGPVLLVSEARRAQARPWRVGVSIDGDGVREWIDVGSCTLFRLPDSDYHAWERLSEAHGSRPGARNHGNASMLRRAAIIVAHAGQWRRVLRLSACGWEQARHIARLERAILGADAEWMVAGLATRMTRGA